MIEIVQIDGRACPKIFCDSCGEEIADAKAAGAVVYINLMPDGDKSSIAYVHKNFVKGDCMKRAEEAVRSKGKEPGWAELTEHLAYLISNVGMTSKDVEKRRV
ncbi:MAG: hypothetical protein ACYCY8_02230 [Burkholderiales bacterium]